ncbi:MAG: DNA primase [Clostridia bacterium]|nr:DNA primase [Clostridia bacterium]
MAIDERFLDELTNRLDMIDVVSRYVHLDKKSGRWWGCCPFHNEKTPSFTVDPDKKVFYCFGCREGGGLIAFVEKVEKLEFPDAVSLLARMAGMEVPTDEREQAAYRRRGRMLNLNREAARFFHENLTGDQAQPAKEYMAERRIAPRMVSRFGLGYAPDKWDALITAMANKGYDKADLLDAGLAVKNEKGRIYDRFRNRLIFPIIDVSGNVLAFGGRVLDDSKPKYLNSPESYVYHKSDNLFALNLAKNTTEPNYIIAEGYMDVLMLHQAGFTNAVASLGTALTEEQCDLLKKRTGEVILCYDSDEAGQRATERAIELLRARDVKIRILRMKGAKDPDEYIKKNGADAFRALLEESENSSAYRLEKIRAKYDLSDDDGKLAFLNEAVGLVSGFRSAIEIELFAGKLAETTGIRRETIETEIRKAQTRKRRQTERREMRETLRPAGIAEKPAGNLRYRNVRLAQAVEGVISLVAANPELLREAESSLADEAPGEEALIHIWKAVKKAIKAGTAVNPDLLSDLLSPDERKLLSGLLMKTPDGPPRETLGEYLAAVEMETAKAKARGGTTEDLTALLKLKKEQSRT